MKLPLPKCHAPLTEGEDIVYSPKKYRETEGIKEMQPKRYTHLLDLSKSTRLSHHIQKQRFQTSSNTPKINYPLKLNLQTNLP